MAGRFKNKTIGNTVYQLPLQGSDAPWGEELSDLIDALVDNINIGASDIKETSATLLNTSGAKSITGLAFSISTVRSAIIDYNYSRSITKRIATIPTGTGVIQIDCTDDHNLFVGDSITIASSDSTPSIDGTYTIVARTDANSFTIDIGAINVTVAGTSGTFAVQLVESGSVYLNYGQQGWNFSQISEGDAFVELTVTAAGQVQYTPTVLDGTSHSGLMKFTAKALLQT